MKKSEIFKRFIFVPVTCLVMLMLMSGYIILDTIGFLQRTATVFPKTAAAVAEPEQMPFEKVKAVDKLKSGDKRLDINHASAAELMRLPGIGAVKARAIVAQRIKMQGFYSTGDIVCTEGIGTKTFESLREFITVSEYKGEE